MSVIQEESKVTLHYTGKLANGEVFDSSVDRDPLEFEVGKGQLIPGFEKAVIGMTTGEKKTFDIPSDEAYGPVREDLIQEVPKDKLPEDLKPEVGMQLASQTPDGQQIPVVVKSVTDTTITVDANHPLAGQDLTFDIEVVSVVG